MKYLLFGDDTLALRARKQELITTFKQSNPKAEVQTFSFSDPELGQESPEISLTDGFFAVPKLIIFEDFHVLHETNPNRAEALLATTSSADIIFIVPQKIPKASALLKLVRAAECAEEVYESKNRNMEALITGVQEEFDEAHLDQKTISLIRERAGKDDELALQNIHKVLTYSQGGEISTLELDALVPVSFETKTFDALDALVAEDTEQAITLFHALLLQEPIFRILPLCAWQVRQMLLVSEALGTAGPSKDLVAKQTAIHPFVVQKILRVLPNFPRSRLVKGLRMLATLDVDLKQGRKTPEGALQYFILHW